MKNWWFVFNVAFSIVPGEPLEVISWDLYTVKSSNNHACMHACMYVCMYVCVCCVLCVVCCVCCVYVHVMCELQHMCMCMCVYVNMPERRIVLFMRLI